MLEHTTTKKNEGGFTLKTIVVVVAVVALIAAIAIPTYIYQRNSNDNQAVEDDLHQVANTIEAMLITDTNARGMGLAQHSNRITITVNGMGNPANSHPIRETLRLSSGVQIVGETTSADHIIVKGYELRGYHENGSSYSEDSPLVYDSTSGGIVESD